MDFSGADQTPEQQLYEAIWKSVHGSHSSMPAPQHNIIPAANGGDD